MLHHRTTDPAERAFHIAEHRADEYYRQTGDFIGWMNILLDVSNEALLELMGETEHPLLTPVDSTARAI